MAAFLQFLTSGITVGSTYALAALGFSIIYNASGIINFAQGEFIMLGGMISVALTQAGVPLLPAILLGIGATALAGVLVERIAIATARGADVETLIIITIGASLVIRGAVQVTLGKGTHALPPFSGDAILHVAGAAIVPQTLWVIGLTALVVLALGWFFGRSRAGKAMLATAYDRLAAQLVGIDTGIVLLAAFGLSAALGAVAGIMVAPITYTSYDTGTMMGLKGFVAATLGGLGSGPGAVAGGLLLGVVEAMTAGYVSSAYKDAVPFVLILLLLFVRPSGLLGRAGTDRV